MSRPDAAARDLAALLPDLPRWVDARGILRSGHCRVAGDAASGAVISSTQRNVAAVVGEPAPEHLLEAVRNEIEEFVCPLASADAVHAVVPGWLREDADLFIPPGPGHLPDPPCPIPSLEMHFLEADTDLSRLPQGLGDELEDVLRTTRVLAAFLDRRPISFCYPVWETEGWWEASVDTLKEYRGRGLAGFVVAGMLRHQAGLGRQILYAAVDSNHASRKVARSLGLEPCDRWGLIYVPDGDQDRPGPPW